MGRSSARVGRPEAGGKPFDFGQRLEEIDMFFRGRGREHQSMRRLVRNLKKLGVPYETARG